MSTWSATFMKSMIVLDSIDPSGKKGPFLVNLDAGFILNIKQVHEYLDCGTFTGATWLVLNSPTGHPFFKLPHFLGSRLLDSLE